MNKSFEDSTRRMTTTKLTYCAVLIAFSALGAMIKISGSIALDSLPGFYAALYVSPALGGLVAGLGHLLTALTSGFPLTLPMHLMMMLVMAGIAFVFGWITKKSNGLIGCLVGIVLNGPLSLMIFSIFATWIGLPFHGWAMFMALIIPLTLASAVNIILAYIIYQALPIKKRW